MLKKGFTLAEIMIVLTVIGIISAIIMPIAFQTVPDENILKFKKANSTLYQVINELVNSDKYYKDGDLGLKPDGSLAEKNYFCETFSDVVSLKKAVCDYTTTSSDGFISVCIWQGGEPTCKSAENLASFQQSLDSACLNAEKATSQKDLGVLTTDNIYYFEENLLNFFGCIYNETCNVKNKDWAKHDGQRVYGAELDHAPFDTGITTMRFHKIFCVDVDGINKGEDPFGYGIRTDGKIVAGARALEWLEKDIQGE